MQPYASKTRDLAHFDGLNYHSHKVSKKWGHFFLNVVFNVQTMISARMQCPWQKKLTKAFLIGEHASFPGKHFKFWGITFIECTAYKRTNPSSVANNDHSLLMATPHCTMVNKVMEIGILDFELGAFSETLEHMMTETRRIFEFSLQKKMF